MNTRWQKPVLIAFETPGDYTSIETTQAASWALIEDWPIEDGDALDKALLICAAVDAGKKSRRMRARPSSPPQSRPVSTSRPDGIGPFGREVRHAARKRQDKGFEG